jgi:hypothetical protein
MIDLLRNECNNVMAVYKQQYNTLQNFCCREIIKIDFLIRERPYCSKIENNFI